MPYARDTVLAGKLRVVRLLGEGGLGEVYEVEHQLTKHRRALKVLKPQWRSDKELVERFLREASAAGHIGNPHIVEAFDAGTLDDGSPYLLMEMLEGQSLDVVLRWNGRLDAGVAVQLVLQVCDAIGAAHAAGIIHRDLKPENLFLLKRDGHSFVKVLDFGISKFDTGRTGHVKVTDTNTALGTPLYMSPEQMRASREVDERADVYALGVILYECIAGTPPFSADNFAELAAMVLRGEYKPLDVVMPGTPKQLARIVAQAMAIDRTQRFSSADALSEALEPFATTGVTSLTELPSKRKPPEPHLERQLTVSPWGPTAKPDEETHSGVGRPDDETQSGIAVRPTEDATPVAARPNDTTVITRRWPLLVGATVLAIGVGFFAMRTASDPSNSDMKRPTELVATGPATDPRAGEVERKARELPAVLPPVAVVPVIDAGIASAMGAFDAGLLIRAERPASDGPTEPALPKLTRKREPIVGLLNVSCTEEPCLVHLPGSEEAREAPFMRFAVPSGKVYATTPTGKKTKPFNLVFSTAGEVKTLRADLRRGVVEVVP